MHENFLKSEILSLPNVTHGFFGKFFEENFKIRDFNCSKYVGGNPDHVEYNLQTVCSCLNSEKIVTLKQVHGNRCIVVDSQSESDQEADAMVTKVPGIVLGILTADCVPILLADPVAGVIGAAHAGWRGAVGKINDHVASSTTGSDDSTCDESPKTPVSVIESVVDKMVLLGASTQNIRACLGPAIFEKSYTVSADFSKNFITYFQKLPDLDDCFKITGDQLHFNLPKFCIHILQYCGISPTNTSQIPIDTYDNPDRFFSYRYTQKHPLNQPGRNMSAVKLTI